MYKNALEQINEFFNINAAEKPEDIFTVLKGIINFKSGYISLSGLRVFNYNTGGELKYKLTNILNIKNSPFGEIQISRDYEFSNEEKIVFKTCSSIIANLIKDAELSKIIKIQLKALQDGLSETNKAYKSEKIKNDFFSNFSHELRTPLNAIISSSELLSEQIFGELNEKQLEYTNDIRISGLHLLGMINDILDMTKLEAKAMKLNKTEFKLTQAVDEVCNIIKPLAQKKNIKIIKKFCKDVKINADYQKIQQILFNLITNAVKYTNANGEIHLIIDKKSKYTTISVKDNGIGIDKKYHKIIFQKFTQLGYQQNSNGLGLTITKELVKLHKGRISLKSAPDRGSEFIVMLP